MKSKYDGQPTKYIFGIRGHTKTWDVEAISLKKAIALFRVGCMFPHSCSEGRIADRDEELEDWDQYWLSSEPGSVVKIFVERHKVADIPVLDPDSDWVPEQLPDAVRRLSEGDINGAQTTDLIIVKQDQLRLSGAPLHLMAEATVALKREQDKLEVMKREMQDKISLMHEEVARRMKQIWLIELWIGSKEEVHVLRQGEPAHIDTKISVQQRVLCMDEELAVYHFVHQPDQTKEFCAENLEDFDEWLLEDPSHLDQILPQQKGIVALRVRRNPKQRLNWDTSTTAGLFAAIDAEQADRMTYMLVRNGENLYRLWVDVELWPRFFPRVDEWDWMTHEDTTINMNRPRRRHKSESEIREESQRYAAGLLVVQGLVQRSELFSPLPCKLDVFASDMEEHFDCIRNDEATGIGDGQSINWKGYRDWMTEKLRVGVRVMFAGRGSYHDTTEERTRTKSIHDWPDEKGVFEIDKEHSPGRYDSSKERKFSFLYLPNQPVYHGWDGWEQTERKKRVRFRVRATELWPVDYISWRVVRALLLDRSQRASYYEFFPMLAKWFRTKKEENVYEKPFVNLILNVCEGTEEDRPRVERLVRWWKVKNKYHRGLTDAEPKATRMIVAAYKRGMDPEDPEQRL